MQASFLIACYLEPIGAFFRGILNGTRLEKLSPAVIFRKTNFCQSKMEFSPIQPAVAE